MKKTAMLFAVLVLALAPVFAGESCMSGTDCANACPLAKQANDRVATGTEALTASTKVRDGWVRSVLAQLDAI